MRLKGFSGLDYRLLGQTTPEAEKVQRYKSKKSRPYGSHTFPHSHLLLSHASAFSLTASL